MVKAPAKTAVWVVSVLAVVGLGVLTLPLIAPTFVQRLTVGTIETVPVQVEEMLESTGSDRYGASVEHDDVDAEYRVAASAWPWELPPGWEFPAERGVADTPGRHEQGWGVRAAFSHWATATLQAVERGDLAPDDAKRLLDGVEDAYGVLIRLQVLSDRTFIADSVDPLRPSP